MLGLCRVSMGDIRLGVAAYEKAIELSPDNREAWLNLGQVRGCSRASKSNKPTCGGLGVLSRH